MPGMDTAQETERAPEQPVEPAKHIPRRTPQRGKRISFVQRSAIITRLSMKQSKSQIARDLNITRKSVDRILAEPEIKTIISQAKSDMAKIVPMAVKTVDKRVREGSESASLAVLRGMRVLESDAKPNVIIGNANIVISTPMPDDWQQELAKLQQTSQLAINENADSVRSLSGECSHPAGDSQVIDITPDTDTLT